MAKPPPPKPCSLVAQTKIVVSELTGWGTAGYGNYFLPNILDVDKPGGSSMQKRGTWESRRSAPFVVWDLVTWYKLPFLDALGRGFVDTFCGCIFEKLR